MIECLYRTAESCQLIDAGVGLPILITDDVCDYCIKTCKDEEARKESYPVRNLIYGERQKRGLPVEGERPVMPRKPTVQALRREHPSRPNIANEMLAAARSVPRRTPAPVVADPNARLAICEECSDWSATNQRCKAACGSCSNRPRPMADKGRDCPRGKWRRG